MPTAAKMVAALCFGLLAAVTCTVLDGTLPATRALGPALYLAVAIGAVSGWRVSGAARRARYTEAAGTGLHTALVATVLTLLVLSVVVMADRALQGRYRGLAEAVQDGVRNIADFAPLLASVPVLATLFFGGIVAGMVTEFVGRRWR